MISIRPLSIALALSFGLASTASFAATDMNHDATKPHTSTSTTHGSGADTSSGMTTPGSTTPGTTAGEGSSVNSNASGMKNNSTTGSGTNSDSAAGMPKPKNNDGSTNSLPGTDNTTPKQ